MKKGRKSGGFFILFKKYLSKKFKILKKSNNYVWIEIDKNCIKILQTNFIVVATYISDITSTYYDEKIFEELYADILKYTDEKTPILFTGDFNGRTGERDDSYRENELINQEIISTPNTFVNLPKRKNCDSIINSHGEKIIQLCLTFDLKILNGRMSGDAIGNFTHLNTNKGESTIDYSICNKLIYESIDNFIILPLNEKSDHSKIVTLFKKETVSHNPKKDTYKWNHLGVRYKWDKNYKRKFIEALKINDMLIDNITQRIEAGLIDSTGEKIQKLFLDAAKASLESKKIFDKNWKKNKKSKKWFDKECNDLKRDVRYAGKQKYLNPQNSFLKSKYHEKLKEYKRNCKTKRFHFWQNKFRDIENSLCDTKLFWDKWKTFSETDVNRKEPEINGEEWYKHFSNLHTENCKDSAEVLIPKLSAYDNISSEPFTKKEFMNVISSLKNNKAVGLDSIFNEMIKNSPEDVLNMLLKFINLCWKQTLIPRSWCLELITPIFKDGDLHDPNNYRGICISSALLKVICSLLKNRIQEHCNKSNLIDANQIGFKSNHRTADHLLTLKAVVKKYVTIGKKKSTLAL